MFFFSIFICFDLIKRGLGDGFVGPDRERGHWNPFLFFGHLDNWELNNVEQVLSRL